MFVRFSFINIILFFLSMIIVFDQEKPIMHSPL